VPGVVLDRRTDGSEATRPRAPDCRAGMARRGGARIPGRPAWRRRFRLLLCGRSRPRWGLLCCWPRASQPDVCGVRR
jgi:hypothetical protein